MAEELVIQGSALGKQFGENVIAVEDANFTIPRGSFISLVGPSGCGKSTLLRLISGLIEKSGGEKLEFIPCLNDNEDHINLLEHLINKNII